MRLDRTALVYFSTRVSSTVTGFVTTLYIARTLGAGVFGRYALTVGVLYWLSVPANGVGSGIQKRISGGESGGPVFASGLLINLVVAGSVALAIVLFSGRVNAYLGTPIHELLIGLLFANVLYITVRAALVGEERVSRMGVLRASERLLRSILQIGLVFFGAGLFGLVFGYLVAVSVATVAGFLLLDLRVSLPSVGHVRDIVSFAKYTSITTLQSRAYSWLDTIVLGFFAGPELVGIYEVAWRIASTLGLVSGVVQTTVFPRISKLEIDGNYDRVLEILSRAFVFVGIFAIPGLFGAAVIGDRLLRIYRPVFAKGAVVLVVLVFARLVGAYYGQLNSAIVAIDRPDIGAWLSFGFVALNAVLNVILVSVFGWHGAAVATALSVTLGCATGYWLLGNLIGFPEVPYRPLAKQLAASLAMTAILLVLKPITSLDNYTTLGLLALGAGVYWAVLLGIAPDIRTSLLEAVPPLLR